MDRVALPGKFDGETRAGDRTAAGRHGGQFDSPAFEGVPVIPDFEWLRGCVDCLSRGNA
jgi:hypothetical protein